MAYADQDDIEKKCTQDVLVQLTDLEASASVNTSVLAEAIEVADREIDSYIRVRGVTVPMTTVPSIITQLSVALAIAELYINRGSLPEAVKDRRDWARNWLKDYAVGKVSMGDEDQASADPALGAVNSTAGARIYTRTLMAQW